MKRSDYEAAGVSIDRGNELVARIKPLARATQRPEALGELGGFGALFDLSATGYRQPVLVSGTDGAGTKIKLAIELGRHDTIGMDLVAMCVNDILALGAEPLFFLDYFACSRLDVATATDVVKGIARGCELSGCALTGGETAEMPGMYQPGDYDLAGFCVGVVEKQEIITGEHVREGDALIALSSSGPPCQRVFPESARSSPTPGLRYPARWTGSRCPTCCWSLRVFTGMPCSHYCRR